MTYISSQSSLDGKIKSICDIIRRDAPGALQYVPETSWLLFLRILDEKENLEEMEAKMVGASFTPSLACPYRWQDWGSPSGEKRKELQNGLSGDVFAFINGDLIPHLKSFGNSSSATGRQRIISQIVSNLTETQLKTERNFLDVIDKIDEIRQDSIDKTHIFPVSQAYEGLLLRLGDKNNDGGQFFTPREVIRAIIHVVKPEIGETVYDPACGTGGFLAQSYEYMKNAQGESLTAQDITILGGSTFYGREKAPDAFPIALANLMLHGIDDPHIWAGNTLTKNADYDELFSGAPDLFDVILMNPPFGGKEGADSLTRYPYKTSSTQILFLQEIIDSLANNGRAGIVVDEGLLFRTNEKAFVQTKRKLLDECDIQCIVSLPSGVFIHAGSGGVKTNLIFFNKGKVTENIWYYDMSDLKVTKRKPITLGHFDEFFKLLPGKEESENSWTVNRKEIEDKNYDLKAVNLNKVKIVDTRTPEELISIIEEKGIEIQEALSKLKNL